MYMKSPFESPSKSEVREGHVNTVYTYHMVSELR